MNTYAYMYNTCTHICIRIHTHIYKEICIYTHIYKYTNLTALNDTVAWLPGTFISSKHKSIILLTIRIFTIFISILKLSGFWSLLTFSNTVCFSDRSLHIRSHTFFLSHRREPHRSQLEESINFDSSRLEWSFICRTDGYASCILYILINIYKIMIRRYQKIEKQLKYMYHMFAIAFIHKYSFT
jgi:hypothetical protein